MTSFFTDTTCRRSGKLKEVLFFTPVLMLPGKMRDYVLVITRRGSRERETCTAIGGTGNTKIQTMQREFSLKTLKSGQDYSINKRIIRG